jgi:HNH endonuclease
VDFAVAFAVDDYNVRIDAEDVIAVAASTKWRGLAGGYILGWIDSLRRKEHLHRLVAERMLGRRLTSDEEVDHINRDPSDNRRVNLRVVDRAANAKNRTVNRNSRSGVRGVWRTKFGWTFQGQLDGKVHCKSFATLEEARLYSEQFWSKWGAVPSIS